MLTIPIEKVTLYELERKFGLQFDSDPNFFREWQDDLPTLTIAEQERLQRVQAISANLERRSVLENTVKIAIASPLLDLAGFFLPPFYVDTETTVEIFAEESDLRLRGRIDVLVLVEQIWVLVIESKRAGFSLKVGIPQALSYMMASPHHHQPLFGLVTNGSSFMFLKLMPLDLKYGKSKELILGQDHGLALTLQILKKLAVIAQTKI
jgi:hypothetical protein